MWEQIVGRAMVGRETGKRSSVLQPLLWAFGIICTMMGGGIYLKADLWIKIGVASSGLLVLISLIGAYFYCLLKFPDGLRSEPYALSRIALEKGAIGDSQSGFSTGGGQSRSVTIEKKAVKK